MNPYRSYTSSQLDTRSPGEQVAALFAKAAEHMQDAVNAIDENDIARRYESSQKAMTILEGLMTSLNRDTPERVAIARDLEIYYKTMINLISRVNIHNDRKTCVSLVDSFQDMAGFWKKASEILAEQSETQVLDQADMRA